MAWRFYRASSSRKFFPGMWRQKQARDFCSERVTWLAPWARLTPSGKSEKGNSMTQTIVVTGAAGGIGSEICRALARDGLQVVVADFNVDAAESLANRIERTRHRRCGRRRCRRQRQCQPHGG